MSIKDALRKYIEKETPAIETIRLLTGVINPDLAVDLIVIVNQICRHELGDLDTETFKKLWQID